MWRLGAAHSTRANALDITARYANANTRKDPRLNICCRASTCSKSRSEHSRRTCPLNRSSFLHNCAFGRLEGDVDTAVAVRCQLPRGHCPSTIHDAAREFWTYTAAHEAWASAERDLLPGFTAATLC